MLGREEEEEEKKREEDEELTRGEAVGRRRVQEEGTIQE